MKFSERLFRVALLLLPPEVRRRHSPEILEAIRRRMSSQARVRDRVSVAVREIAGLLVAAVAARRSDRWARPVPLMRGTADHPDVASGSTLRRWAADHLAGDIRFAFRTFARRPLTFGFAILSLAFGIGVSSAMFSVVDKVLFRPLPFRDAAALVAVYPTDPDRPVGVGPGSARDRGDLSWIEVWDLQDHNRFFADLAAYSYRPLTFSLPGLDPRQIRAMSTTPSFFHVLGVSPILGTSFEPADTVSQDPHAVLLTEEFWRSQFGGDPHVVGRRIFLDEQSYIVQGVMPQLAEMGSAPTDLWLPRLRLPGDAGNRNSHTGVFAVGRLRTGASLAQAQSDVQRVFKAVTPPDHTQHGAALYPLQFDRTYRARPALILLFVAAALLLLVGCANVALMQIGLALDRRTEFAIRVSLGASRTRLAMQLFTESMVLALLGGLLAVPFAAQATHLLVLLAPSNVPRIGKATVDSRVLLYAFAVSVFAGVGVGIFPALKMRAAQLRRATASARGAIAAGGRAQSVLVVVELALAAVLLIGGTLLGRTLLALDRVDVGFSQAHLMQIRLVLPAARFSALPQGDASAARTTLFQQVADAVAGIPGVRSVAETSTIPLGGGRDNTDLHPEAWQPTKGDELIAERRFVSTNYFSTMGITLLKGRDFAAADDGAAGPKTMIVSAGLAHRIWPTASALGKRIRFADSNVAVVVGVVADVRDLSIEAPTSLAFYVPAKQYGARISSLIIRVSNDAGLLIPAIRDRIRAVDRSIVVASVQPFQDLVDAQVAEPRYRAQLMIVFALLATLFAGVGVFGVTARSVARRTREIGVRVALGASPHRVLGMVLLQGVRLACIGGIAGVVVSLAAGRAIRGMLYGVQATDPVTLLSIAGAVCLLSITAALPPALRALRVTPMEALRSD
jgi:putative ABC transport system permease protein